MSKATKDYPLFTVLSQAFPGGNHTARFTMHAPDEATALRYAKGWADYHGWNTQGIQSMKVRAPNDVEAKWEPRDRWIPDSGPFGRVEGDPYRR